MVLTGTVALMGFGAGLVTSMVASRGRGHSRRAAVARLPRSARLPDGPRRLSALQSPMAGVDDPEAPDVSETASAPGPGAPPAPLTDESERHIHRRMILSGTALTLAFGSLAVPVLGLGAAFLIGFLSRAILVDGLRKFRRHGQLIDLMDVLAWTLMIALLKLILATVVLFGVSVGRRLLIATYDRSRRQLASVFGDLPRRVWLLHEDGTEVEVDSTALNAGDVVVVQAGDAVPADGCVVSGAGLVDQHRLTGEAQPVEKEVGSEVLATTLVVSGRLLIRVHLAGRDTQAAAVADMILATADRRLAVQVDGEATAERFVPYVMALAGLTAVFGSLGQAVAVYLATPGYDLRVLGPLALLRALQQSADAGVLIKDGRSLDLIRAIDTVVFDKTGTLTNGALRVASVVTAEGGDPDTLLLMAAAAEGRQGHPIAEALRTAAAALDRPLPNLEDTAVALGRGIMAVVSGWRVHVGSLAFLRAEGMEPDASVVAADSRLHAEGLTCVHVAIGGVPAGLIALDQDIRPEAIPVIRWLRRRGLRTAILSGDSEAATRHLAEQSGIDTWFGGILPGGKAEVIARMQAEGRRVCFVGDGINDAAALQRADVSISIQGATTLAVDTAQVVLMRPDLSLMRTVFDTADAHHCRMRFSTRATILAPITTLPVVLMGVGGGILVALSHDVALVSSLVRIFEPKPGPGRLRLVPRPAEAPGPDGTSSAQDERPPRRPNLTEPLKR